MKLHTVFITYNRLDLTKRAIESYLETVTLPYALVLIDNASTDGTIEWASEQEYFFHFETLPLNLYPGYACNLGWSYGKNDITHFQRADNDFVFLPGWCDEVEERFQDPTLGQLGMRTDKEETDADGNPHAYNVGGNNIIIRDLWKKGLRYTETPWPQLPPGYSEDTYMSPAVEAFGYRWERVRTPCIQPISVESAEDPYYQGVWGDRRIHGFP